MNLVKRISVFALLIVTTVSMSALPLSVKAAGSYDAGSLLAQEGVSGAAVYYIGSDGMKYIYPDVKTYNTWYDNFDAVVRVDIAELDMYTDGGTVTYRQGTKLVTHENTAKIYAVEPGGVLRWIPTGEVAEGLYGADWGAMVSDVLPGYFASSYSATGADLDATFPDGTVVVEDGGDTYYYIADGAKRAFASMDAFEANNFNMDYALTADLSGYGDGESITGQEIALSGYMAVEDDDDPVTGDLTVALAASTPAVGNIIADSTNGDGAQARIELMKVNFTASSEGDVDVTTIEFNRGGVPSADTDFADYYLYEGDTYLADYSSVSEGLLSFVNSNGLFTVSAGETKTLSLVVNLDDDVSNNRNVFYSINESGIIASGNIGGSFPINGNAMSVVHITDLGKVTIADGGTSVATIDPGELNQTIWDFTLAAADQDIQVEEIKITLIGTIDTADLANFELQDYAGAVLGTAVMASDKTVTFDLDTPYAIEKGNTKHLYLKADILSGTDRTYTAYLYNKNDLKVLDMEYNIYLTPNQEDSWTRINAANETTINTGSLTVARGSSSASGNVPMGASSVEIGQFDFTASGEDLKIDTIYAYVDMGSSTGLYQFKLFVDGSQVGTAIDLGEITATSISLGNSLIVPAGETKTLTVKADMLEADGTALTADETITFQLGNVKSCDYTKQSSGGTSTGGTSAANVLTVKTGALGIAENLSLFDYSATNPLGVAGALEKKIASFVLTAGAGEDVNLSSITIGDDSGDATEDIGDNFQNLILKHDDVAIANTQGSLSGTAGADFQFSLSDTVVIPAGTQYVVDVYADILTGAAGYGSANVGLEFVTAAAVGEETGDDMTGSLAVTDLQNLYIASAGSLAVTVDAATPDAGQLVMGEVDAELARLQFTTGVAEGVNISRIELSETVGDFNSSLSNVKFYDGETLLGTVASFDATDDVELQLPTNWFIGPDTTKVLVVKGTVNNYPNATSGATVTMALSAAGDIDTYGADSGTAIAETVSGATGTAQDIYRTGFNIALGGSSPSGSATPANGATVLEFTVSADSNYDAVLNAVDINVSGTIDTTGTGNAVLYKSTDLSTALATESYVTATGDDSGAGDAHSTTELVIANGDADGIPMGANVRVYDATGAAYFAGTFEISKLQDNSTTDETIAVSTAASAAFADGDIMYYRPLQPGTGELYFGSQTVLGADIADAATAVTVASTDGFSLGDTIVIKGYSAAGAEVTSSAGGVISQVTSATALVVSAVTVSATIDYDYLSGTAANAIANGHNSEGIVYVSGLAETISAGSSKTFVVKGDTTGATSNETLQTSISTASDVDWDDNVIYSITTDTDIMPVNGGTLTY